eukprot:gene13208-13339_t
MLQVAQQSPLVASSVVTFSSLNTPADLSAAIAAAPSQLALQNLASAANTPHQLWLTQELKVELLSALEGQDAASLTKVLLFYAKLGPGYGDLFQQAVPVLYNSLGNLQLPDLMRLLVAFSTAAQHSPEVYSQELYAALTEFLWEGLASGQLDAAALADVAWGYAVVQHYNDDEDFFGALADAAVRQLETFCPDSLSRLVHSLGLLRYQASSLTTAALQQMSQQLEGWPLSCIGQLLWGVAAVQAQADPCLLDRLGGHISVTLRNLRTSTDGQKVLSGLGARTAAAAAGVGGTLPHPAAALKGDGSSFAGLAGAGGWGGPHQGSDWQVSSLHSDCRPVYDDAEALQGALVNIAWSFSMLGHCHSSLAKECFKALALVLPEAFSDEQLTMLWASHMR